MVPGDLTVRWPPCTFCGDPVYGLAAADGIHPCCAQAEANEASTCIPCDMARNDTREPRPLASDVTPVAEWDWDEIGRLEALARQRLFRLPKCRPCGQPMVCGQTDTHITCQGAA